MHQYWGFGLRIASEFEIPELLAEREGSAEVTVKYGTVPEFHGQLQRFDGCNIGIGEKDYFLEIPATCRYYVDDELHITVEPFEGIDGRSVRIYLLATVMAFVLHRRGHVPLHASAIRRGNELILLSGDSGSGKSTALAGLSDKGYQVFSDDVCVLSHTAQNLVWASASYPMIKLWEDAVEKLDSSAYTGKDFPVKKGIEKYGYFFHDSFSKERLPVKRIIILRKSESGGRSSVKELQGLAKFAALEQQVYRKSLVTTPQQQTIPFNAIAMLANQCQVFEITRPLNQAATDTLQIIIENIDA